MNLRAILTRRLLMKLCNCCSRIGKDYGTTIIMATHDYIVINKFPARMIKTEKGKVEDNATISML